MEPKSKELLIIDPPNELRFSGPFNRPRVTIMKLTNPTEQILLFKIKTTAPKRYCVRPNFGSVQPQSTTKVEICLQPFIYDPNERNKHKFMVQSLVAPNDAEDYNKLWKEANAEDLMDAKLKCVFEMPSDAEAGDTSGSAAGAEITKEESKSMEKISNLEPSSESVLLRQAHEENMALRKEVIDLQEQMIKIRSLPVKPLRMDEPYAPVQAEKQIPMFYIAISIAAAIFGLLLGKYLL